MCIRDRYNTLGAPIVIYVASDLMQLYIYRQFISTLPVSLDAVSYTHLDVYKRQAFWIVVMFNAGLRLFQRLLPVQGL